MIFTSSLSLGKVDVLLTSLSRGLQCDKNAFCFSVGGVISSIQRGLPGIFAGYVINTHIKPLPEYEKMVVAILALKSTFPSLIVNRNNWGWEEHRVKSERKS